MAISASLGGRRPPLGPGRGVVWALGLACAALGSAPRARAAAISISVDVPPVPAGTFESLLKSNFNQDDATAQRLGPVLDQQVNTLIPEVQSDFLSQLRQAYQSLDPGNLLRAMADASAGASRLMPNDYGTEAAVGSLSAGLGVTGNGFSLSDIKDFSLNATGGELPALGVAPGGGGTLTFHLRTLPVAHWRYFDPSRLTFALSFLTLGPLALGDEVTVKFSTYGLRAAYQLLRGHSWARHGLARWGGLSVGLGVNRTTTTLAMRLNLPNVQSADQEISDEVPIDLRLTYGGAADVELDLGAWSVPLEIYSHLQVGGLLTFFGGLGVDVNWAFAGVRGDVTSSSLALQVVKRGGTSADPVTIANPQATLDAADRAGARIFDGRGFFGLQLNFLYAAVFAQASADTAKNVTAQAGLRLFF